jgi:copper(I)-binding protein
MLAAVLAVVPMTIWAHAFLDHAAPAVGGTVAVAPAEVTVWFTEPPAVVHDALKVFDGQNHRVDRDDTHAGGGSDKALTVSLQKLLPGHYRVVWRVLASTDGHVTSGNFTFDVGASVGAGAAAPLACDLAVEKGWIRTPTPNATMLAGYVVLRGGHAPLTLTAVDSPLFGQVQMHDSGMSGGMMQMRPLAAVTVPAGAALSFSPEGRHLMLSNPVHPLREGEHVRLRFSADSGCSSEGDFVVASKAP